MDWLNFIYGSLKFTVNYSTEGVEYLDLFVYSDETGKFYAKLNFKPSDTFCYLVPYNTARRVKQSNSQLENYVKDIKELFSNHLIIWGHKKDFVREAFQRA